MVAGVIIAAITAALNTDHKRMKSIPSVYNIVLYTTVTEVICYAANVFMSQL